MSGGMLASLTFLHPWILAGLAALPVLWWLLRVTPPAPRRIDFPATRFLAGLIPEHTIASHTPWWILLLRLCIVALTLLALAHPIRDAGDAIQGRGPLRLVIDNGWEAAQTWPRQMETAHDLLARAGREGRPVILLSTAPLAEGPLQALGPMGAAAAQAALRGLAVSPWPADYGAAQTAVKEYKGSELTTLWLSTGVGGAKAQDLADTLSNQGSLSVFVPAPSALPLLLRPPEEAGKTLAARLVAPSNGAHGVPVTVQAVGEDGRVLDAQTLRLMPGTPALKVAFDIPDTLRNAAVRIQIAGRAGAGAALLLDETARRRAVGLVETGGDGGATPFIGAAYYLSRALQPFADVAQGSLETVLASNPSLLLLPDTGAMAPGLLERMEKWVREGGTLVRFAGPKMAASAETFLTPVPLRSGGRAQGGAMSWDKPLHLARFPEHSPLRDLTVPADITVRQQVLADSGQDEGKTVWAQLEDGTPLITAAPSGSGLLILVHTTATPEWSDFALSGLFVEILRKFVALSATPATTRGEIADAGTLQPERVFDGQGTLVQPGPLVRPIAARDFASAQPGPDRPPGYYGTAGVSHAFNLGSAIHSFAPMPDGLTTSAYGTRHETDLMPWVLATALGLALLDWAIMLAMGATLTPRAVGARAAGALSTLRLRKERLTPLRILILTGCLGICSAAARAEENAATLADAFHLAYVRSGSPALDRIAQEGLSALGDVLRARTSVDPGAVVGIEPGQDDLSFFPILYWPIGHEERPLSDKALAAVQAYLDHGGAILFDTRDAGVSVGGSGASPGTAALRRTIGALDLPGLVPVPKDHVLTRSFYLLDSFPGRYEDGRLWVESQSVSGRDGVSSVLIGGNDWAAAWADSAGGYPTREQEMALRFGVNLIMYALTGNYKADQVHIPYILERLGRRRP